MRFADLMLRAHLIGNRFEAIGIIADQHLGSHTLSNRLNPLLKCFDIFGWECIDGQGQATDRIDRDA